MDHRDELREIGKELNSHLLRLEELAEVYQVPHLVRNWQMVRDTTRQAWKLHSDWMKAHPLAVEEYSDGYPVDLGDDDPPPPSLAPPLKKSQRDNPLLRPARVDEVGMPVLDPDFSRKMDEKGMDGAAKDLLRFSTGKK